MGLPNYSPEGIINFGNVPWDNSYDNIMLFSSLTEQYETINGTAHISSDNYTYIGRNRRIKVAIPADKLYHCNYCWYKNASVTKGWIYCFITDVEYINDNTSEITIETDVFQTYLYNIDWTLPPCFVERETVANDKDDKYLLTAEPDFSLLYTVDGQKDTWFENGGYVIISCDHPTQDSSIAQPILNPSGWYGEPVKTAPYKGIPQGCEFHFCHLEKGGAVSDDAAAYIEGINKAGCSNSVLAIFSVPKLWNGRPTDDGNLNADPHSVGEQEFADDVSWEIPCVNRGNTIDGYTPRNRKLLYYPYTFCRLTDYNGTTIDLKYELFTGTPTISFHYLPTGTCQCLVWPNNYQNMDNNYLHMATVPCGALGSWSSDSFQTWFAQNSGQIMASTIDMALTVMPGGASIKGAEAALKVGKITSKAVGERTAKNIINDIKDTRAKEDLQTRALGMQAANLAAQAVDAYHQPTVIKGNTSLDLAYATGTQGVHTLKMCVKSEIAEQIDQFFDMYGYNIERIKNIQINSRKCWNYVKTQGACAKSMRLIPNNDAPFNRGAGTPAAALSVISSAFDNGITFWHSMESFGDYSQDNSI